MAPLAVDPETLSGAGAAVVSAGDGVAAAVSALTSGYSANTGQDAAGEMFGLAYQDAAKSLLKAAAAGINACRQIGFKVQVSASNYSRAETASRLGGGGAVLSTPTQPGDFAAPGVPWTLGPGVSPPMLWMVVQTFVGDLWPDGNAPKLHAAAGYWRTFGSALDDVTNTLNEPTSMLATQQLPEGDLMRQALSTIGTDMGSIGAQCGKLASALDDFANDVQRTQDAIRDLLHRLGSASSLWQEVVAVVKGDGLEEVKKIANDIKAVLDNMKREAQAQEQMFQQAISLLDSAVLGLERFADTQFTHFLGQDVGSQVSAAFNFFANTEEGVLKDGLEMAHGLGQLDPKRFAYDPEGAAATWNGMTRTGVIAHILNPEAAVQADKELGKSLLHLDDWRRDRPGLGFGENLLDVATLFVPGLGEAGPATKVTADAADAADAAAAAGRGGRALGEAGELSRTTGALGDISKTTSDFTKDLVKVDSELPKTGSPPAGRPIGLPPPRPLEAPLGPTPHAVESAPPVLPHPLGENPAAPVPSAPERAAVPSPGEHPVQTAATPGENLPPTNPPLAEPTPAAAPASPGGYPSQPVPAATHTPQAAPAFAAPHAAPTPHTLPPASHPPEPPPPHGGAPGGPGDSAADHDGPSHGGHHPITIDTLTPHDLSALADYTGAGYQDLNSALRSDALDASQQARMDALNKALEKLPIYDGPVVRGTNLPPDVLERYRPGEVITESAFTSTTTNPAVAYSPAFVGNVEFRILSSTGRDISSVSMFPGEQEILFPADTKFYVINKTVDPLTGRTIIEMIER